MLLQGKRKERAPYFLHPGVHHFLALSMAVVVGRFVSLALTAFFLGRTSTPEEEEEEEADEEEEEVLASLEDAKVSLPLDESESAAELASSSSFHSQSARPSEASEKDVASLSTANATFKVIGFITVGIFLARSYFFTSSLLTTTNFVKSRVFGGTVGWHRAK